MTTTLEFEALVALRDVELGHGLRAQRGDILPVRGPGALSLDQALQLLLERAALRLHPIRVELRPER